MKIDSKSIKDKLIIKAVRNVRKLDKQDGEPQSMYRDGIKLDLQRSLLMTESYKETEGEPMVFRRAKALERILSNMDIYIQDWEMIVGNNVSNPQGLYFGIDMNWRSVKRMVTGEEGKALLDDEGRKRLGEMVQYWKGKSMSDIQQDSFSGDILDYWKITRGSAFVWTHWSELGIPDYEKVFKIGLKGFIKEAEDKLVEIDKEVPGDYIEQKEFLQAVVISLKSVINFANRYANMARQKAKSANDKEDKERMLKIADICERVPEHPPETFQEAIQSFFFLHIVRYLEYSTLGIGVRFDKVFGPFLENDLKTGAITREEALTILQLLWVKFHELGLVYSPTITSLYGGVASLQAITIGGTDNEGKDITNEMTYLVLETAELMRTPEPSIVLRYHDDSPRELLSKAVDVIHTGIGYPALFNDRSILPMLESWNVPLKDARNYAITGCVYLEIPGKNMARRAYGALLLPMCLWYALHQGIDSSTGEQYGAPTPDPRTFKSEQDLMDAYLEQVRFFFGRQSKIENSCRELYEKYLPRPFYSALIDGCIEKGSDLRKWTYPSPVSNFCVILGPANVADSITAIKKTVFEEGSVGMDELLKAMDNNWEGREEIRQMMINAPKYGNDDDYADSIAADVHHKTSEVISEFTSRHGYQCRGDGSGVSATYGLAGNTPATPDGREFGDPFCDATLSPSSGMDREGPTAVLKSASKIKTEKTYNHLLNQKFLPSALEGEMKDIFIDYLKSWGDLGISQAQFNVVERETLLKAQENPEEYSDLLVRVAGYSAYFVDLSKGLQDSIIARTEKDF